MRVFISALWLDVWFSAPSHLSKRKSRLLFSFRGDAWLLLNNSNDTYAYLYFYDVHRGAASLICSCSEWLSTKVHYESARADYGRLSFIMCNLDNCTRGEKNRQRTFCACAVTFVLRCAGGDQIPSSHHAGLIERLRTKKTHNSGNVEVEERMAGALMQLAGAGSVAGCIYVAVANQAFIKFLNCQRLFVCRNYLVYYTT